MLKYLTVVAVAATTAAYAIWFVSYPAQAEQKLISVGTGGVTGVYYPTGGAICRQVNERRKNHGFRCWVEETDGSVSNVKAVRSGELHFGIVQSDSQYRAYHGLSQFEDVGAFDGLRAVFSIYPEPVTILARADAKIENLSELRGRRVNIGNVGSGARATWEALERALSWKRTDLASASEFKAEDTGEALCTNQIDAYFWVVGHPSALTEETLSSCASNLVHATGPAVDKLIADHPFYSRVSIPAGTYTNKRAIQTFGVRATLVTSSSIPVEEVYAMAMAVLGDIEAFKMLHPAFANLTAAQMISENLTAPLHEGALMAYRELGLMK